MTTLVPRSEIERLVQRRRHQTAHIARKVGDVVYLLHSLDCLDRGDDLRLCGYSQALDIGCDHLSWEPYGESPVFVAVNRGGLLIPAGPA